METNKESPKRSSPKRSSPKRSSQNDHEEIKKNVRMNTIYKALEEGWTVKKSEKDSKTFEFTKYSKNRNMSNSPVSKNSRRSISAPIVKKN
jgi:hypothetical protein